MPSYLREPSGSVCWNCERRVDETLEVTLRPSSGGRVAVQLCSRCYDREYLLLVAHAAEFGILTTPEIDHPDVTR